MPATETINRFLTAWNDASDKILVHTSGSTGKPKPLWVEKRRMLASARITCDFLGLKEGDTALLCLSTDFIAGKMMVVRALERKMRLITVEPSGHPLASVEQPIDFAAMVPMQVYNTLQVPEERDKLMNIRHLIIGGGAIDDDLAQALKDFPHFVWSTYGMTETLSHIALRRLNGAEASGYYVPFDGVDVSLNEDHCLVIHAPRRTGAFTETPYPRSVHGNQGEGREVRRGGGSACFSRHRTTVPPCHRFSKYISFLFPPSSFLVPSQILVAPSHPHRRSPPHDRYRKAGAEGGGGVGM